MNSWTKLEQLAFEWVLRCFYTLPFQFWGHEGCLWQDWKINRLSLALHRLGWKRPGSMPAPWGGFIESIVRRRRRCINCGQKFWREGAFNPFAGVNIWEEHCSAKCADEDLERPY